MTWYLCTTSTSDVMNRVLQIIALVIEGKAGERGGRRPSTKQYKRLKTEDVMPSLEKSASSNTYVFWDQDSQRYNYILCYIVCGLVALTHATFVAYSCNTIGDVILSSTQVFRTSFIWSVFWAFLFWDIHVLIVFHCVAN